MNEKKREEIALFRFGLIVPFLSQEELEQGTKKEIIRRLSEKHHQIPFSTRNTVGKSTIRRYLRLYQESGFDGLKPKSRADVGSSRKIPEDILKRAMELKVENHKRSVRKIIRILEAQGLALPGTVKRSTLARILTGHGLTRKLLAGKKKVWGRFEAERPNQIWQSDCLYGPYLPDPDSPGKHKRTYLFAFIDDFSRLVPHAEFYWDEKLPRLENTLKKALLKRGIPESIYVDNGQVYSSHQMNAICAELGIRKITCQPYSPEGKGKIEKFLGFVTSDFLSEVEQTPTKILKELNEAFWAWLEVEYHQKIHSETKESPLQRWQQNIAPYLRTVSEDALTHIFLWRASRKVTKTATISLMGIEYELSPLLANRQVEVRYNPFDLSEILIYYKGQFHQKAEPFTRSRWTHKAKPSSQPPKEKGQIHSAAQYLAALKNKHLDMKRDSIERPTSPLLNKATGPAQPEPKSSFHLAQFIQHLAQALGRTPEELHPEEMARIQQAWRTFGPFSAETTAIATAKAILNKGRDQHISFYLEAIKEQQIKFKQQE